MKKLVRKNKKGFTLTEMIVVIAIIGILAAVLIPSVVTYVQKAKQSAADQQAAAVYDVYEVYETEREAGLLPALDANGEAYDFFDYYQEITGKVLDAEISADGKTLTYTADNGIEVDITLAE